MPQNTVLANLLAQNVQWARGVAATDPDFFKQSNKGQTPHTLWIGCSDSRVPETLITGSRPGDIFVQRNIANQFPGPVGETGVLSALRFSVVDLGVQHVIVVGHSNCGGVDACLAAAQGHDPTDGEPIVTIPDLPADAPLNRWLAPLTKHLITLGIQAPPEPERRGDDLAEAINENIKRQVQNLCESEVITNAWANNSKVWVHGWVYDLSTGGLEDLKITQGPAA